MNLRGLRGSSRYLTRSAEIYDVYDAKWICEQGAKFVRKEEINLSDRGRCYFIYSADEEHATFLARRHRSRNCEEESNGTR